MRKMKAVVVGSGFGGLSTAIRLLNDGFEVKILEKRNQPGGRAYVYREQGFTFDAGPTVITAPESLEELFTLSGKRLSDYVELLNVSPFYRLFWEDGTRFDYSNDTDSLLNQIRKISPRDVKAYQDFLKYSQAVFDEGYTKLAHVPFLNWWSMIRVAPQLAKLRADRSVYKTVAHFIEEPHLRQAFSFHSLLVGGNPFTTSSIYTLIHYLERKWGVFYPKGGTGALVRALIQLIEDLGGEIVLNAEIDEILTDKGRVSGVRSVDGRHWDCDLLVSNADVVHTYQRLLRGARQVAPTRRKVTKASQSMSLFLIYFGTRRTYPELAHHNVIFGPRYRELLEDIFKKGVLADDFSLYLHAPTKSDASMAPPGCEAFYVLSPVPHLGKGDIDWKTQGPRYADRILDYLEKHYIPDLRKELICQRIFTPEDFKSELNSHLGSAFSLEPVLSQSAYFRTHNRDRDLAGLYFVGAGTHPGAGVPGVVASAKATASVISKDRAEGLIHA